MALKKYAKLEDIPEHLREDYKQVGNEWVPDLGDAPPPADSAAKKKEAEWRALAQKQREQLEALQAKLAAFGDLDPGTIGRALDALSKTQNDEEVMLAKAGRVDEIVARRTKAQQDQWSAKLAEVQKKLDAETKMRADVFGKYGALTIQQQLRAALAAKKLQLKPTAMEDVDARVLRAWKVGDDLSVQPNWTHPTGDDPTMENWTDVLVQQAPHLFVESEGAGTKPGSGPVGVQRVRSISGADLAKHADAIATGKMVVG